MSHGRTTYLIAAACTLTLLGFSNGEVRRLSAQTLSQIGDHVGPSVGATVGAPVASAGPTGDGDRRDPGIDKAIRQARSVVRTARTDGVDSIGCPLLTEGIPAARRAWEQRASGEAIRLLSRGLARTSLRCRSETYPKVDNDIQWRADRRPTGNEGASEQANNRDSTDGGATPFWHVPSSKTPLRDQARILRARVYLSTETDAQETDARQALDDLKSIEAETPVDDYIQRLKAKAYRQLNRPADAADALHVIHERFSTSGLRWKARTQEALLRVEADQPERAIPILNRLLTLFPDHPRRFRLLYYRALAHQKAGRLEHAAEAFQRTWLAFPHKKEGELARARYEQLEDLGIETADIAPERLLDRFRDLRINKHWELAGTHLRQLLKSVQTESGHSALTHRIWFELGMNAYTPQYFERALPWFEKLRRAHDQGHTAGIDPNVVDKYLERTYGKLGRLDDATDALERRLSSSSDFVRTREKAELLEDHQRYEEAYKLLDSIYSDWSKKRWQYTWLLYKTGRLDRAADHFRGMVARRHGTGEEQARYWLARTLERDGETQQARQVYISAVRDDPDDYYGIQAASRLRDMKRRDTVSDAVTRKTRQVVGGSDDVLAALETAAEVMEERRTGVPAADETMIPKSGGVFQTRSEGTKLSARECWAGSDQTRRRCHLAAGTLPPEDLGFVGRLLSPRSGLSSLSFGTVSGMMFGRAMQTGTTQPTPSTSDNAGGRDIGQRREATASSVIERARRMAMNEAARSARRLDWHTPAHLYWEGRSGGPPTTGDVPGPIPEAPTPYGDAKLEGSIGRVVAVAGDLLPALRRSAWLHKLGYESGAREAARQAVLEFRGVVSSEKPEEAEPIELETRRWHYLIDHRPYQKGYWSYTGEEVRRFPVPEDEAGKKRLVARQRALHRHEGRLRDLLTDAMMEIGDFHMVRQLTSTQHSRWYTTKPGGRTAGIWRQMHPRAFARRVLPAAKSEGLNPYMVWSLMGVESAFNPDSVSRAEAIGLLQVIPRTGIKVAAWIGDEDFGPYDLINAPTAIRHGTSYFGSLVKKFRGQILLAIIGYNAGPHRVSQWLKQRGRQPLDEFIEEVPFSQARGYVRKVTGYLKTYLTLYEGERDLYIGQRLDRDAKFYPNF